MEPLFFGTGARPLFGAYHESSGAARGHGVIFAYPGPQEYMYSHYAFRLLAVQLAHAGFSILRFDWSGTGDSAGDTEDACFSNWREDLQAAEKELMDLARPARLSVVAFRLGAAIAASTDCRTRLTQLILWEPVISGHDYLAELRTIERYKLASNLDPPAWWKSGSEQELLGHALTPVQRAEIEAFDLMKVEPRAHSAHVITGETTAAQEALVSSLCGRGIPAVIDEVKSPDLRNNRVMLSSSAISHIVGVLKAGS